jgi:L-seryl-tRNA(Ser) seleniumtransferase
VGAGSDAEALRSLPAVHELAARLDAPHVLAVAAARRAIDEHRAALLAGGPGSENLEARAREMLDTLERPSLRRVINATGVILHTNLGRAPLSHEALRAMEAAAGYTDLELDLDSGSRGSRQQHVRRLLTGLTGAAAAHVAVNNAAAVTLALAVVARGKDVIVSRGQSVEIGGGFRVPIILRQSGARLIEVGTTNRTRLEDYEEAISPRTAALLHVHSSNFRMTGFTEEVPLERLSALTRAHNLLLLDDNGSGSLLDTKAFGLTHEPTPIDSLRAGADIVAFSGDKLLGGPQAGILLGRDDLVTRIGKHALARAVRPDKISLAALSATLLSYLRGDAAQTLPIWRMIGQTDADMRQRAERWQARAASRGLEVRLRSGESTVGGGSLPGETLPTTLLTLPSTISAARLRSGRHPVLARTRGNTVLLDLRTVQDGEEDVLLDVVLEAARIAS